MRRITFISPVASVQGNMSGKQNLVYPLHDNKAFEGPDNSVNYARNYRPSFIGAKRKSDGACSFQVKRRTANHLTTKAKSAMANLGGVGAIYSALVRDKSSQVYLDARGCYDDMVTGGYTGTFRKFMYSYIKPALDAKNATIDITTLNHHISINNPWVFGGHGSNVNVPFAIIEKFFAQLNPDPIFFRLVADKGDGQIVREVNLFAQNGLTWLEYIDDSGWCDENLEVVNDRFLYWVINGKEYHLLYDNREVLPDSYVNTGTYYADFRV